MGKFQFVTGNTGDVTASYRGISEKQRIKFILAIVIMNKVFGIVKRVGGERGED